MSAIFREPMIESSASIAGSTVGPVAVAATETASPNSAEEAMLLERLRRGDEAAYESLVRAFGGRLFAVARRLLGNEDDAREALQDGFVSAFKSVRSFAGSARLGTWLHRIVVNAALMKLRSRKRFTSAVESIDELLPTFEDDGHRRNPKAWSAPVESGLERSETRQMVRKRIDELPSDYRTVLILRDIEELDTEEAAAVLGITSGAVKTRLHRARLALRELLEREFASISE